MQSTRFLLHTKKGGYIVDDNCCLNVTSTTFFYVAQIMRVFVAAAPPADIKVYSNDLIIF